MAKSLIIGVTGTREEPSLHQLITFEKWIKQARRQYDYCELHHGDCTGADHYAHVIATKERFETCVHPPTNKSFVMNHKGSFGNYPDKPYLDRNKDIVDCSNILIGMPATFEEVKRSGTWSTIRYGKKQNKDVIIIFPDGTIEVCKSKPAPQDDLPFDRWMK